MEATITSERADNGEWILRVYAVDDTYEIGHARSGSPELSLRMALDQMRAMGLEWDGLIHEHGTYC